MTTNEDNIGTNAGLHDVQPGDPPHPRLFLRRDIVAERELIVGKAAEALRVLRPTLSAVLNGRAALSPEMTLRCEKAFGVSVDALMSMQCAYDAAQMRAQAHLVDVTAFVPKPKPG